MPFFLDNSRWVMISVCLFWLDFLTLAISTYFKFGCSGFVQCFGGIIQEGSLLVIFLPVSWGSSCCQVVWKKRFTFLRWKTPQLHVSKSVVLIAYTVDGVTKSGEKTTTWEVKKRWVNDDGINGMNHQPQLLGRTSSINSMSTKVSKLYSSKSIRHM